MHDELEKVELNANIKIEVTGEDIKNIVCAAFEDGIAYWCNRALPTDETGKRNVLGDYASDQLAFQGGVLILHDMEDDRKHELTLDKLLNGIQKYIENPHPYDILVAGENGVMKLDCCQVDAVVADMIVQYAIFDEVIYG